MIDPLERWREFGEKPDYDGGHKALVRLASGEETIVGGSRVDR